MTHSTQSNAYSESNAATRSLVIGTRGSALALHQARYSAARLSEVHPGIAFELEVISSEGDIDKESPLTQIGGRGVFTSSLQRALAAGRIDAAVHSSKDVPSLSAAGLALAAFPQREDPRDVVVSRHGVGLAELPPNPVVGTSSRRRAVQVLAIRPDAIIADLRGNIDTRLRKAASEQYDAIILAAAGISRMGWLDRATELLPVDRFIPAPGQGALAIETWETPDIAFDLVAAIDDPRIRQALEIERAFLRGVGGGCTTPLAAHAVIETLHGRVIARFWGMLARDDGDALTRVYEEWPVDQGVENAFGTAKALVAEVHPNRVFGAGTERTRQLKGMNVLVTGTDELMQATSAAVRARGGKPIVVPTIRIAPPGDTAPLVVAGEGIGRGEYDWVVLTSRQGVRAIATSLKRIPAGVRVAAIGEATAAAVRDAGVEPAVVAEDARAEGMLHALKQRVHAGERVLLPVSSKARTVIEDGLRGVGADVTRVDAYDTQVVTETAPETVGLVERGGIGAVLLASPSAVEGFMAQLGTLLPAMSGATFVAIGEVTADSMRERELPVHVVSATPGGVGMVDALGAYLWGRAAGSEKGSIG